jgi:hypothetical protein
VTYDYAYILPGLEVVPLERLKHTYLLFRNTLHVFAFNSNFKSVVRDPSDSR